MPTHAMSVGRQRHYVRDAQTKRFAEYGVQVWQIHEFVVGDIGPIGVYLFQLCSESILYLLMLGQEMEEAR